MKNRSELREIIMKVLYQVSIYDEAKVDYDIDDLIHEALDIEYKLANKYLKDWKIERLNKVDQAILSIGIYELMYTETPSVVSINEAIELSKKYSEDAVVKMINGVLDKVYHEEVK